MPSSTGTSTRSIAISASDGRQGSDRQKLQRHCTRREADLTNRLIFTTAIVFGLMAGVAQADMNVKIGVLNDRSGVYADLSGEGSVVAAQLAVEDFKAAAKG